MVAKPGEPSALEARIPVECFDKAALPPAVVNVVNGPGATVGSTLTRSPDVQRISFTGSTEVGR